jgi:hypothetical protein
LAGAGAGFEQAGRTGHLGIQMQETGRVSSIAAD